MFLRNNNYDVWWGDFMNSEDVIVYLTTLVGVGVIIVGILATLLHSVVLLPIVVIGIILTVFLLLSRGNFSHKIESMEKICFVITLIAIICSFILLYKPM